MHPPVAPLRRAALAALVTLAVTCGAPASGNAGVAQDFAQHRSHVEVTVTGRVESVLGDASGPSGAHQRFIVELDGATQTVLVDNNVTIGRRAPVSVGDEVSVHGEYVWNAEGGLVHFTHHDPEHTHEGGWIEVRGARYE
ncbi:MAG: DUF3465 domain-containing protein [Chloroflexota bacterium]|nr:DUF3465 domain-containing protein [Chloroflexota bacterium]MDE3101589.1 DUF3465 domain-containing protein [Chloroflexota bacterium]